MALQNFLQGGFTGKLGAFVGQKYYGRYHVRAWAMTPVHTTPAAMLAKQQFTHSVALAQEAMSINKGDPSWQHTGHPEWPWRCHTALGRIKAGLPDSAALPLYPDGYNAITVLTDFSVSFDTTNGFVTFDSQFPTGNVFRKWRLTIDFWDATDGEARYVQIDTFSVLANRPQFILPNIPAFQWSNKAKIVGVTLDNDLFGGLGFELPEMEVSGTPAAITPAEVYVLYRPTKNADGSVSGTWDSVSGRGIGTEDSTTFRYRLANQKGTATLEDTATMDFDEESAEATMPPPPDGWFFGQGAMVPCQMVPKMTSTTRNIFLLPQSLQVS